MLDDIFLGFRDFWKYKVIAIFYILFFTAIMFTLVSSSQSLIADNNGISLFNNKLTRFDAHMIGKGNIDGQETLNNLSSIYEKNSYSFYSLALNANEDDYVVTYILFGDLSEIFPYFNSDKDMHIYAGKNISHIKTINLNGKEYPVDSYFEKTNKFYEQNQIIDTDNNIFIVIQETNLTEWIDPTNYLIIDDIIENTKILTSDTERINKFLNYSNSDLFNVVIEPTSLSNQETYFILNILYPFILLMIITFFLITYIILDQLIRRRIKEFTIYLLHGAKISNILIRFISFFSIILFSSHLLGHFLGIIRPSEFYIYIIIECLIVTILSIIILIELKKKNLFNNLRKD